MERLYIGYHKLCRRFGSMRRLVLALTIAWTVGTACSGSPSANDRIPTTAVSATSVPGTATPPSTAQPRDGTAATSTTARGSAAPVRCSTSTLTITAGPVGAALGHAGGAILFRNTGDRPCRMVGYPTVSGLDGAGRPVVRAEPLPQGYLGGLPTGAAPPTVDLSPGQTASALVEGTNIPTGSAPSCTTYAALSVAPPDQSESVRVPMELPGCSGLRVHPVVAGETGTPGGR